MVGRGRASSGSRVAAALAASIGAAAIAWAAAFGARAQDEPPPEDEPREGSFDSIDSFADAIAESLSPTWQGPRTPWPERRPRPASSGVLRAPLAPVNVHTAPGTDPALAVEALDALARAHDWLAAHGWPLPVPDGGYGETGGFDLYLVPAAPVGVEPAEGEDAAEPPAPPADGADPEGDDAAPRADDEPEPAERVSWVSWDAPVHWRGLDTVDAFGVIEADRVDPGRIEACTISTYVRAALLSNDPAEARAWRIATGDFVSWLLTGRFGCTDRIVEHQRESWRGWIGDAAESGEGGALMLAMLSARTDDLSGDFIRDLWQGTAQLTWEGSDLRASPDMWQVIYTVMEVGRDPLLRLLEEMGVARYFAGSEARAAGAPMPLLDELPEGARVPVLGRADFAQLPRRFEPHGLELEPYGSAYVEVDTAEAPPGSTLRIWLRGEYGVAWSLTAVRLGADGRERGRTRAPVRPRTPRSYIPLELTDGDTAKVVIVVTNLGARLVDADEPDDQVRSFRLILDDGEDDDG